MERSFFLRRGLLKDFPECPLSPSRSLVCLPSVWALFVSDGWLASRGLYDEISASFFHLTVCLSLPAYHPIISCQIWLLCQLLSHQQSPGPSLSLGFPGGSLCNAGSGTFPSAVSLPGRAVCFGSVPWMV